MDAGKIRLRRGSVQSEKSPEGRVYVWMGEDACENKPRPEGEPSALIYAKDESATLTVK